MQTGVIYDLQKWCNTKTVPSTCSIHGAYWYQCYSKLILALFIWKEQKRQLEQPGAKASIWPESLPMCPTIDHRTHSLSASLQHGSRPLCPLTESRTLIPRTLRALFILLLCSGTGEGNGTPLQYSCLENPMDGGAWWAAVHGIAKSRTRLSDFTFTFLLGEISIISDMQMIPPLCQKAKRN